MPYARAPLGAGRQHGLTLLGHCAAAALPAPPAVGPTIAAGQQDRQLKSMLSPGDERGHHMEVTCEANMCLQEKYPALMNSSSFSSVFLLLLL